MQELIKTLRGALKGGISCFQYREKGDIPPRRKREIAIICRDMCKLYGVPFIVNDDLELALEVEADGVHLGQTDTHPKEIEKKEKFIIGMSVSTVEQALEANEIEQVDYLGVGPIFPTISKKDAGFPLGTSFLEELVRSGIRKPMIAIGGIKRENAKEVTRSGASGVAVISAIARTQNPEIAARQLLEEIK